MGLTSSLRFLLLCALALGVSSFRSEYKLNSSLMMQKPVTRKKILLNVNGRSLVNGVNELQTTFKDYACQNCTTCMERAIKAYRVHSHVLNRKPNVQDLFYEVLQNNGRKKRSTTIHDGVDKKAESGKIVSATVTKYTKDGKVYAIKVKENGTIDTCKLYSVKKPLSCDSSIDFSTTKKKINKRTKKPKTKISETTLTTESMKSISAFKKREVDNSQLSESFMPSVEELMY